VPEVPKSCAASKALLAAQSPNAALIAQYFIKHVSLAYPVYPEPQAQANQRFAMIFAPRREIGRNLA
jgi:hypothetical protein